LGDEKCLKIARKLRKKICNGFLSSCSFDFID